MGALLLSFLAGSLTTLSPCVLPILPIVLLGALQQHRFGPFQPIIDAQRGRTPAP